MVARQWRQNVVIALDSALTPISAKPVRLDNGVPVYRFRGELIRCGNYTTADGTRFSVTPKTLRSWAKDFHRMKAAGVPVPMPTNHAKADDADANRGFVVDMQPVGDSLEFTCELYGQDAPKIAVSNHVSLYAEPDWEDGNGNQYAWPIRHVALTPDPRIPGLRRLKLAASNGTFKQAYIARSMTMAKKRTALANQGTADDPMNVMDGGDGISNPNSGATPGGSEPLDVILDALENDYLPRIREAKDKSERVALAKEMAVKMTKTLAIFVEEEADGEGEGKKKPEPKKDAEGEDDDEPKKPKEDKPDAALSNPANPANLHPELIRLSNENRQMRIEKLFETHKITAHQRKQLLEKFTGAGPVKLALSNAAANATFEETLTLLAANQPIREASTSWQTLDNPLALSNKAKDDPETAAALEIMHQQVGMKKATT